jgi:pilus assembly protein CpaB
VGRRLLQDLRAGDPLTRAALQPDGQASLAARLRDGNRAVTVPVDEVSSQAGLVRPGDHVDLLLAEERLEGPERCVVVRSLLESLPVLATGQMQQPVDQDAGLAAGQRDISYSTITLDVTPEQAQQLAVGLRVGELIPMLRGEDDRAPVRLASMGTQRTRCRTADSPAGMGSATSGTAGPGASGTALELMVGGRDSVERSRHWLPEG